MNNSKIEDTNTHLHFGHLGLVLGCAGILVGIMFMKADFKLSFNNAKTEAKQYTLEQAKREVVVEYGLGEGEYDSLKAQEQLALIDPDLSRGSVLGASSNDAVFPAAEEILSPQVLDSIKLNIINVNSQESITEYAQNVLAVESRHNVLSLLGDLNSSDPGALRGISQRTKELVSDLATFGVPSELEKFHKMKMIYYIALGDIADSFAGVESAPDINVVGAGIFSLIDAMEKIKTDMFNRYQVELS